MGRWHAAGATLLLLGAAGPPLALGQGLTGAALEGTVRDSAGRALPAAVVDVLQLATGERWRPRVAADGRFVLEHISAGGPYRVTARAVGYRPVVVDSITLASGQRERLSLVLVESTVALGELRVTASASPSLGPGRVAPEHTLNRGEAARFPQSQRNLINLGAPAPSTSRFSLNGWNPQLTAFRVDGGQGADLYAGNFTGRPVFGSPIPIEAIEEVRVQSAPYDVRYGQLASGQFHLTTLRPASRWTGSAYGVFQNEHLVSQGSATAPFTAWTGGLAAAGPLIRDRLGLAVVLDFSSTTVIDRGPFVTDTTGDADYLHTGIQYESAERFRRILADTYGLDAGTLGASNSVRPRYDLWGKLSAQLGTGSVLDITQRVAAGHDEGTIFRTGTPAYLTGSTTRDDERDIVETRAAWRVQPGGRWSNEILAGFRSLRQRCSPAGPFPRIVAAADNGQLAAGADSTCVTTDIRQQGFELAEHATFTAGRHVLTGGFQAEWYTVQDPILTGSQGSWTFASLDALEAGHASLYERTLPGPLTGGSAEADFRVLWFGGYAQDRFRLGERVDLTVGLRADLPVMPDEGPTNPAVLASLGVTTGRPPDARPLWSPRAGLSWDVTGRGTTWVRAGAGSFAGRPPYRWLAGIYRGSGGDQVRLHCADQDAPPFDPVNQPTQCGSGAGAVPLVSAFDPGLRFPQIAQVSLGLDQQLPAGFVLTGDLVLGRALSQFRYADANLTGPVATAAGEAGRSLYGQLAPSGAATVARKDPALGPVVLVDRGDGDRTLTMAVGVKRPLQHGWGFEANYRWSDARDYQSLEASDPLLNLGGTPLEGTHAARTLGRSLYQNRHRVFAQLTVGLPWEGYLSIIHVGNTGNPYSYVVDGDANADGLGSAATGFNDLVYVPRDVRPGGDVRLVTARGVPADAATYATLDSVIAADPCLQSRRGALAIRNGCTNPWVQFTNARVEVAVPTVSRQRATLAVDIYNLPNLLNGDWGQVREVTAQPVFRLLRLRGWDAAAGRGVYQLRTPLPARQLAEMPSRWRLQFTARYRF